MQEAKALPSENESNTERLVMRAEENQSDLRDKTMLRAFIEDRVRNTSHVAGNEGGVEAGKEEGIEDELVCPVCHSLLFRPVTTYCGHSFCGHCLMLWVESTTARNQAEAREDPQSDRCPMCRSPIDIIDAMQVDKELEQKIIAARGEEEYRSRHRDAVTEKVERLIASRRHGDVNEERGEEMLEATHTALEAGARASIVGSAFAGPAGMFIGLGLGVAAPLVYRGYRMLRTEEMHRFGILEDDGNEGVPDGSILFLNMSLTRVEARICEVDGDQPLQVASVDVSSSHTFHIEGDLVCPETTIFRLDVVRPVALMDKELAKKTVSRGHAYLLCCTDAAVQHDTREECDRSVVKVKNVGQLPVRLSFYDADDGVCFFACAHEDIQPGSHALVQPEYAADTFKVVVWAQDEEGYESEIATVHMRRGECYSVDSVQAPTSPGPQLSFQDILFGPPRDANS